MSQFKVGDRVRVKPHAFKASHAGISTDPTVLNGEVGTVLRAAGENDSVWVKFNEGVWPCNPFVMESNLELVSIRESVFDYLTSTTGSTGERQQALADLALARFFVTGSEEEARDILQDYLTKNQRGFCRGGITRFRNAVNFPEVLPKKSPLHPQALTLGDLSYGDMFQRYHDGTPFGVYVYLGEKREKDVSGVPSPQIKVVRVNRSVGAYNPGEPTWLFTGDAGLTPYGSRLWNRSNHCLRAGIEPQKVISRSRRTIISSTPLVQEADPEIDRLLEEEEAIERSVRANHISAH